MIDETGEGIEYVTVGHRLTRLHRPSCGKHRELPEQLLLLGIEEVVAPGEHGPQSAVALGRVPPACGEELKPLADPIEDLRNGEDAGPRSGQLDRQGQAIDTRTDLGDVLQIRVLDGEAQVVLARAAHEQLDGGVFGQRRHWKLMLTRYAQ